VVRPEPPAELVEALSRLELATHEQLRRVAPRVRRLARDLPLFESVWIDALAQARVLTPFQAAEINAGRGDRLRIGSLVLCQKLASNGLGQWFVARDGKSRRWWRLMRIAATDRPIADLAGELETLVTDVGHMNVPGLLPPRRAGVVDGFVWAACEHVDGIVAADWLAQHGRLPPDAVLEIARQMLPPLAALQSRARPHGDLAARQLILCGSTIALPLPCVRAVVRPAEGYSRADLPPEAFDGLAPERVLEGTPPTCASDLFALGCLWWHLLTGRTPLAGGDALSKLRSAQTARIADVRQLAPDTPTALAEAIAACLQADPARRPQSIQTLAAQLGGPSRAGKAALARCLARSQAPRLTRSRRRPLRIASQRRLPAAPWMAAAAMLLLAVIYFASGRTHDLPPASIAGASDARVEQDQNASASILPQTTDGSGLSAGNAVADTSPPDRVLIAQGPQRLTSLSLKPGQTVRGQPGQRPRVLVGGEGFVVDCEDVTFENIDFVCDEPLASHSRQAILQLRAYRLTLRGCSFQSATAPDRQVAAIVWCQPAAAGRGVQLPTGSIELVDCAFGNVAAAIDCELPAAMRLDLVNCLHLGPGPLVKRSFAPRADEPCLLSLTHCTLREAAAVLSIDCNSLAHPPGEIEIRAVECAMLLAAGRGLLEFSGTVYPEQVARAIQWTGQGSLLGVETPLAVWRQAGYETQRLAEENLFISGLVRSQVQFAGRPSQGPAASRLVRWQAPLKSLDPPGITEAPLHLPEFAK
jgi:serine/threonine-protein kinase